MAGYPWLGPGLTHEEIGTVTVLFDVRSLISSTQPRLIDPNQSQNPTFKDSGLSTQASPTPTHAVADEQAMHTCAQTATRARQLWPTTRARPEEHRNRKVQDHPPTVPVFSRTQRETGFFFFLNLNLYSARVQLGTEVVTFVKMYYAYKVRVGGGSQRELAMGVV